MVLIRELKTIKPHYLGLVVQRVNDTIQQINCNQQISLNKAYLFYILLILLVMPSIE